MQVPTATRTKGFSDPSPKPHPGEPEPESAPSQEPPFPEGPSSIIDSLDEVADRLAAEAEAKAQAEAATETGLNPTNPPRESSTLTILEESSAPEPLAYPEVLGALTQAQGQGLTAPQPGPSGTAPSSSSLSAPSAPPAPEEYSGAYGSAPASNGDLLEPLLGEPCVHHGCGCAPGWAGLQGGAEVPAPPLRCHQETGAGL